MKSQIVEGPHECTASYSRNYGKVGINVRTPDGQTVFVVREELEKDPTHWGKELGFPVSVIEGLIRNCRSVAVEQDLRSAGKLDY